MYEVSKRALDIAVAGTALLLLAPAMLLIAAAIRIDSRGPVFYRGIRAGVNGNKFRILKFRSMIPDAENRGGFSTAANDARFTRIGRFLRRYKLDELPQFINVLVGDMSLVGPRPQVLFYTERYNEEERQILSVKPGITDLASLYFADMDTVLGTGDVDARYQSEIEPVKNRLRLRYVRERSFLLDLRILVETALRLAGITNATRLDLTLK